MPNYRKRMYASAARTRTYNPPFNFKRVGTGYGGTRRRNVYRPRARLQFGGKILRKSRKFRASRRQKYTRRVARAVGYGNKSPYTLLRMQGVQDIAPLNHKRFKLSGATINGLGSKLIKDLAIPLVQANYLVDITTIGENLNKVYCISESNTIRIKNQSNTQCILSIVQIKCIRDIPDEESNLDLLIGRGFEKMGLTADIDQFPCVSLSQNKRFFRYFKIEKMSKFYLNPGSERSQTMWTNTPRTWSQQYANFSSYLELKGARKWLVIHEGSLVHDTVDANDIGTSANALDILFSYTGKFTVGAYTPPTATKAYIGDVPVIGHTYVDSDLKDENATIAT